MLLERIRAGGHHEVRTAEPATRDELVRVHPEEYLDRLAGTSARGGGILDADTVMNRQSWHAALGAAGACLAAVRHAHAGTSQAFAAVRPPGHHALAGRAMGFCLLANAVLAAREAQALGRKRLLMVDWDVHHGNGTQDLVERDATIRFVSLHEWPAYPGTGAETERGVGNVFNVPRPAGLPPERYVADLEAAVDSATDGWQPEFLLISAGFDSMRGDPLGGFTLEPEHYGDLLVHFRARMPGVPVAVVLEGGYNPSRLADGVMAVLRALG